MALKVLEFYSGIGGMCMALKESGIPHEIVNAFDINNLANDVYRFNFPKNKCTNRVIESLTSDELKRYDADLWTMSPPCQPFTRLGKQMDTRDNRTNSFLHLLQLLPEVLPKFILLENVKGFETSEAFKMMTSVLDGCDYVLQRFLLSPLQFGTPNARLRFYLLARRKSQFAFTVSNDIRVVPLSGFPLVDTACSCPVCFGKVAHIETPTQNFDDYLNFCSTVSGHIVSPPVEIEKEHLILKDKDLRKGFKALDIVNIESRKTCCFTKRYTQYLDGTGSVLQTGPDPSSKPEVDHLRQTEVDEDVLLNYAKSLRLRFFSSREIANLMNFPQDFSFPDATTYKQRVRLLGNSINVKVVSHLLYWLLKDGLRNENT